MDAGGVALGALTHAQAGPEPARHANADSFSDRFHVPPYVVCARHRDAIALLNRRSGSYVTLDGAGRRIWDLASGGAAIGEIVEQLESEYDVARERLEADVGATLAELLAGRFLERGRPHASVSGQLGVPAVTASEAKTFRMPSVLRCGLAIFAVKRSLRARGFEETLAWIRRRVEAVTPAARVGMGLVRRAERAVATAGAFYPGRALCLEQSLALYLVLRSQGVAVKYCQGVQFHPFQAHAWVEYEGEVINDVAPHVKHFARFPDQLP